MGTSRLNAIDIVAVALGIGTAAPSAASVIWVNGHGDVPGTTTTYICSQTPFPSAPPACPSTQIAWSFPFSVTVAVDPDALTLAPASFHNLQVGNFFFADFSIALLGLDQWGNYIFEGQDLSISGTTNLHPCFGGADPCTIDMSAFSGRTFTVEQIDPKPVPEPTTWLTMLLGFVAIGSLLRRTSKRSHNRVPSLLHWGYGRSHLPPLETSEQGT
ncbi:PEPxxWA-CTERM sorting domain-containing protein [Sphingomonas daechungensis]|uniref:PEPxxWA-CTERM sorting domain-containing protein n=1 Tax=Sphingomonas daechungensis TaxID=1176646 RepID=A0ABX6T216_9SPHN|nr:PEPxxWA-CTERM sorting domain-containing protein [Sphingomonas daechungensis]